ncbi:hypothetical protein IP90_00017 [Luteimonas cucumeris]|uniref:Uncharacterized protein n=1 Tax=Luteimonas cucumeris TaxID=985012 RepID=A0A562LDN1_9GAMM|nr:hypothetical protein [Luteimonas cucumeris]TWI05761.1 hypothetical protein IP90_00017 [Luteimonas cucumeris]
MGSSDATAGNAMVGVIVAHPLSSRDSRALRQAQDERGGNPATLFCSSFRRKPESSDFDLAIGVAKRLPTFQVGFPPAVAVGSLSLEGSRESNQREGPSPIKANVALCSPRRFSDSPSWLGRKTAAIPGRRPPGLDATLADKGNGFTSTENGLIPARPRTRHEAAYCMDAACFFSRTADEKSRPEGRRTGRAPFSDRAMGEAVLPASHWLAHRRTPALLARAGLLPNANGESENPVGLPRSRIDVSGKALSFGYFSLGQQRKVTRRQAEALAVRKKQASIITTQVIA